MPLANQVFQGLVQFKNSVSNRPSPKRDLWLHPRKSRTVSPGAEVGERRRRLAKTHSMLYQPAKFGACAVDATASITPAPHLWSRNLHRSLSTSFSLEKKQNKKTLHHLPISVLCTPFPCSIRSRCPHTLESFVCRRSIRLMWLHLSIFLYLY